MDSEIIHFKKIGTISSPHKDPSDMPRQPEYARGIKGKVFIDPEYAAGLQDLEGFSHIYLICFLHKSKGYHLTVTPPTDNKPHGVFATRSPNRPNPVSLSVVKLISIEENVINIENIDLLDGTPVLDIKPYLPKMNIEE